MSQSGLVQTMLLLIPAAFGNMAPVIFAKSKFLAKPISRKQFGANKTWRGVFFAIVLASLVAKVQAWIYPASFSAIDLSPALFGAVLGFAAIFGDLLKSYFKRRVNIAPGKPFLVFDQIDWIVMSLAFIHYIFIPLSMKTVLELLIIFATLHLMTNWIAYKLKLKNTAL